MKDDSPKCTFATMANHSVNEVLVRSLNTSITSLIPVAAMLIFGGETLRDFALAMTVGLVCGCYSSYAIATPIYVMWKTREPQFAKLQLLLAPPRMQLRITPRVRMLPQRPPLLRASRLQAASPLRRKTAPRRSARRFKVNNR